MVLTSPLGRGLRFEERVSAPGALRPGQDVTFTLTVVNDGAEPANDVVVNDDERLRRIVVVRQPVA